MNITNLQSIIISFLSWNIEIIIIILIWLILNLISYWILKNKKHFNPKKVNYVFLTIVPYLLASSVFLLWIIEIYNSNWFFNKNKKFENWFDKKLLFLWEKNYNKLKYYNSIIKINKQMLIKVSIEFIIMLLFIVLLFFIWQTLISNHFKDPKIASIEKFYKDQVYIKDFIKENKKIQFSEDKPEIIKIWLLGKDINYFTVIQKDKKDWIKTLYIFKYPYENWETYKKDIESLKQYIWIWTYNNWNWNVFEIIMQILTLFFFIFIINMLRKQINMGSWDTKKIIQKFNGKEENNISFDNIGWIESIKEEIKDIVWTLKNWAKFKKRGVRLLRWILFYWPAWVWKTMIAKAIASELWVNMFIATWNDFRWKYLWQWAEKVHSTFKRIKEDMHEQFIKIKKELNIDNWKLSILFIDEIDTVFKKRGSSHPEDDTIVNAFLHEMDWIEWNSNIIVIWATNHIEKIDDALLSRIDKKISFKLPTRKERLDITNKIISSLKEKDKLIKIKKNLDLSVFSANTYGLSGRDLDNILNEIHRKSIIENKQIDESYIQESFSDYILGKDNTWLDVNSKDKEVITYHELWHWVIWFLNWKTVHTITIIPKWNALGLTWSITKEERILKNKKEMLQEIQWLVAGREAEKIWFWEITTWASNDYERATQIAFSYFKDYNFDYNDYKVWFVLNEKTNNNEAFESEILKDISKKVSIMIKKQEEIVNKMLLKNKSKIDKLAIILKTREIIEEWDLIAQNLTR